MQESHPEETEELIKSIVEEVPEGAYYYHSVYKHS